MSEIDGGELLMWLGNEIDKLLEDDDAEHLGRLYITGALVALEKVMDHVEAMINEAD